MNRSALVSALCALVLIQAYVVYYIFVYGPLRGAVPYDDCGVILRSLQNLDVLSGARSIEHATGNQSVGRRAPVLAFRASACPRSSPRCPTHGAAIHRPQYRSADALNGPLVDRDGRPRQGYCRS